MLPPDWPAFAAAIAARPADQLPRLVAADYLDEQGFAREAEQLRLPPPIRSLACHAGGGGAGVVAADGVGVAGAADGAGGAGGDDAGGYADVAGGLQLIGEPMPKVGTRMLIFLPGWYGGWRYVADVAEQTGPYSFRLENAWYVWNPGPGGGRAWPALARGEGRDQAEFVYYGTVYVGPEFGPCLPWVGELPEEERPSRRRRS